MTDVVINAPLARPPTSLSVYKLTIYQYRHGEPLPIHIYFSDSKRDLEARYQYHKNQNDKYLGILTTYSQCDAEVLSQ